MKFFNKLGRRRLKLKKDLKKSIKKKAFKLGQGERYCDGSRSRNNDFIIAQEDLSFSLALFWTTVPKYFAHRVPSLFCMPALQYICLSIAFTPISYLSLSLAFGTGKGVK
jgi:hypothetical protein